MHIQVNGKQIDVGKYAENPIDSVVTFSRDGHETVCDATAHLSTGMVAKAKGKAVDPYAAAESACDRLEKQLRRYKRRLKDHHKESSADDAHHDETWEEPESLDPMIIAEMRHPVQDLTVGEAVMAMEMAGEPFLLFKNNSHGGINVVFRRPDGNIGWIDPANLPDS